MISWREFRMLVSGLSADSRFVRALAPKLTRGQPRQDVDNDASPEEIERWMAAQMAG